jgi:DHA2 family multidrug resistance protein
MNPLNPSFREGVARLAQALKSHGVPPAQAHQMALARIYEQVQRQASMMSYVEIFHILMIIVFCSVPLVFLMRGRAQ